MTYADIIVAATNKIRAEHGLPPLYRHEELSDKCREHAQWMGDTGRREHAPPEFWCAQAENLGGVSLGTSIDEGIRSAMDYLKRSPDHLDNMLGNYTHIGAAAYVTRDELYIVQRFLREDQDHMAA